MSGLEWFPQQYAHEFYVLKGMLGLVATAGIVAHMARTWATVETPGRRLRYYALLYLSALLTAASVEQTADDAPVALRNIGAILGVLLVLVATWVSLREDRHPKQ